LPAIECPTNATDANGTELTKLFPDSEASKGNAATMNTQANTLFNFIPSSNVADLSALQATSAPRSYYQKLIYKSLTRSVHKTEGFELLGRQLAELARHAYLARQMDAVEQAVQMMLAMPISAHLKNVARHYQALCAKRKGDYEGARHLLERVVEEATPQYRVRALQIIGLTYHAQGRFNEALPCYVAAGKAAIDSDLPTLADSQRAIAIVRSVHGDHRQALDDLERLYPLARAIGRHYPASYYDYLNSLAVELGEVGRLEEARNVCRITLASPLAAAYPNWLETRDEIEAKRAAATASIVAVSVAAEPAPSAKSQPARKVKSLRSVVFVPRANEKGIIQITIAIAIAAIANQNIVTSFLEWIRGSIIPRGPPACL
jgi:tetratricopeptide (TPR) repeat protein